MMKDISISIIIPTYKPKSYLWDCLDSLKEQTIPHLSYEIIVVLNGVRDPYYNLIQSYIEKHFGQSYNISLLYSDIGSVGNARNIGLDKAKGEFITFIDDDDYVSANYLKGLYSVSKRDVVALAHPQAFDSNGRRRYSIEETYLRIKNLGVIPFLQARKFFQGPCMKLIHRDIIGNRRFDVTLKNGEDALFMFLVSDNFKFIKVTSDDSTYYRRVREDGAAYSKKSILYLITNSMRLIVKYCSIYFGSPLSYNLSFFITRIMGAVRMCLN